MLTLTTGLELVTAGTNLPALRQQVAVILSPLNSLISEAGHRSSLVGMSLSGSASSVMALFDKSPTQLGCTFIKLDRTAVISWLNPVQLSVAIDCTFDTIGRSFRYCRYF